MGDVEFKTVNLHGRIYRIYPCGTKVYKEPFIDKKGYKRRGKFVKISQKQNKYSYIMFNVNGKTKNYLLHRLIAIAFLIDYTPDCVIDHISGDISNNSVNNLRCFKTNAENDRSFRRKIKNTSSKYRGVSFTKKTQKWYASIMLNGKSYNLGYYEKEIDAAKAYNKKAKELDFDKMAYNTIETEV